MDTETNENRSPCESGDEGEMSLSGDSHRPKKKRRGVSQASSHLPIGKKQMIKTNEHGQPNEIDADTRALVGDIGLQVRETLPIGFDEFEDVPQGRVQLVLETLESWGKETRGRMCAMGEGVSPSSMKYAAHMVNKLVDIERQNAENETLVHRLDKDLQAFQEFVTNELRVCQDIGKKYELVAWDSNIVACGEVVEVAPKAIVHNVEMGEGNYKILIESAVKRDALLKQSIGDTF